jgi:nitroreductase
MLSPFATNESLWRLIRAADAAPSTLNTRPWSFWIRSDDRIELRADRRRQLEHTDPRHRELHISCGAALFNLRLAIRVTGHDVVVWLIPDQDGDPDLLASVEIVVNRARPASIAEQQLYAAIGHRHTNREPFSEQRIGMNLVAALEQAARKERVTAWLLHERQTKDLMRMVAAAEQELAADGSYQAEVGQWVGDGIAARGYGVPDAALGPRPAQDGVPVRDFGHALGSSAGRRQVARFEKRARLIALATDNDGPLDWLRTGQAMQRLLLTATRYGVAASFLTQPFEVADRHPVTRRQRWRWPRSAQMVIRLGYGPAVAGTPRTSGPEVVDMRVQPPLAIKPQSAA